MKPIQCVLCLVAVLVVVAQVHADPPHTSYIFPAGGQRGTSVSIKVGGHYLHEGAPLNVFGDGIKATARVERTKTVWFEGPVIPMPASQRKEDYPKDYSGNISIAQNASLGTRYWRVSTSQGVTPRRKFVVGDLPEVVENEIDGDAIPTSVELPVTINGRIFPREDVDIWTFSAKKGETVSCEVVASRIGSPLDSRLEIVGPNAQSVTENVDSFGADSFVKFVATADGEYQCRIHDINFGGLQDFVYRLTIRKGATIDAVFPLGGQRGSQVQVKLFGPSAPQSPISVVMPKSGKTFRWQPTDRASSASPLTFDLGDLPETLETEPNDSPTATKLSSFAVPQTLNGIINRPGDEDWWAIKATAGDTVKFEVFANRLGTELDSVLDIVDETGKAITTNDDITGGQSDSLLNWKVAKGGPWFLRIRDQLSTRGGSGFAYRIKATKPTGPDFGIILPAESITVVRGVEVKLKLKIERSSFKEPIELKISGLPKGVSVEGTTIAKNKTTAQLTFKADDKALIGITDLKITGVGVTEENKIEREAFFPVTFGEPAIDGLTLSVAIATPFKFLSPFETKYASRGTRFSRQYQIERTGYDGEIEIEMADRQVRHLQGVTGQKVVVPAKATTFEYAVSLPPWMEIGRTSRSTLMASAFVTDETGKKHRVSYSSIAQDDQIIVLVDPVKLSVSAKREAIQAAPGKTVSLPLTVNRGTGLSGEVQVELVVPKHIQGISAKPIKVPAGKSNTSIEIEFEFANAEKTLGPFNMPIVVRATLLSDASPVVGEFELRIRK
jgi:hypothetical protein